MPQFSIITVTRNNLSGLRRTGESVLAQGFPGFEWIVIDGNSDDGTRAYLEGSGADFISEPDRGIYDAMNKGIDRATGDYLIFMNAGDGFSAPDTLQKIAAQITEKNFDPDFIYGDSLEERPGLPPAYKPAKPINKSVFGMFTHHQAMLYRRAVLHGLRYDEAYKIAADYKFTLEFLERSKSSLYCPFPLCLFESGGVSQRRTALGRQEQFRIRRDLAVAHPAANGGIFALQAAAMTIRRLAPSLYWWLKQRRGGGKTVTP